MVKTVIGILSYNDKHYLEKVLPTITKLKNSKTVILDNAGNDEVKNFVEKEYPEIKFIRHKDGNTGFGKGHNYIVEQSPESKYYFCLNNDILVEEEGFEACIEYMEKNKDCSLISGKLYHWDYENDKKTSIIDTLGIIGSRGHQFWDRGQGKEDRGQYDKTLNKIFGLSAAAFIIRRSCIKKLHETDYTIFDENFYMYKEDVDLAYRMRWQDMKMHILPNILGYHARTCSKSTKKSFFLAKMSYKNHLIMLRNNWSKNYSFNTKLLTFSYELAKFFFYLVTKPKVAMEVFKVRKMTNLNKSKQEITSKKMESFLLK